MMQPENAKLSAMIDEMISMMGRMKSMLNGEPSEDFGDNMAEDEEIDENTEIT